MGRINLTCHVINNNIFHLFAKPVYHNNIGRNLTKEENDFILGHDYSVNQEYFEQNIKRKIWNWYELNENDIIDSCRRNNLVDYRGELFQSVVWVCKMKVSEQILPKNNETIVESELSIDETNSVVTFVTGLWNIKRDSLADGWSRSYEHYLTKFSELLNADVNLIIYGDESLEQFVKERRSDRNTQFIRRNTDWIKSAVPYEKIQEIRKNPNWLNQSGWLPESTQAKLDLYNPLVMSKMFLLNDASILDPFNSSHMVWVDGALTNTVHEGYFWKDRVIQCYK